MVLFDGTRRAMVSLDLRGPETPAWLLTEYDLRPPATGGTLDGSDNPAASGPTSPPTGGPSVPLPTGRSIDVSGSPVSGGGETAPSPGSGAPESRMPPAGGGVNPAERGAGWVGNMPTGDIHVDAPRFQFKQNVGQGGAGEEFREVTKWDPEKSGVLAVWKDPADAESRVCGGEPRDGAGPFRPETGQHLAGFDWTTGIRPTKPARPRLRRP